MEHPNTTQVISMLADYLKSKRRKMYYHDLLLKYLQTEISVTEDKKLFQIFTKNPDAVPHDQLITVLERNLKTLGEEFRTKYITTVNLLEKDYRKAAKPHTKAAVPKKKAVKKGAGRSVVKSAKKKAVKQAVAKKAEARKVAKKGLAKRAVKKAAPRKKAKKAVAKPASKKGGGSTISTKYAVKRAVLKKAVSRGIVVKRALKRFTQKKVITAKPGIKRAKTVEALPEEKKAAPLSIQKLAKIYVQGRIDQQIVINKSTDITVIVSRNQIKKIAGKAVSGTSSKAVEGEKLEVRIRAVKDIKIIGKKSAFCSFPETGAEEELLFKVKSTRIGKCSIGIDVWQGQTPVCDFKLETNCVEKKTSTRKKSTKSISHDVAPFKMPINQLIVNIRTQGNAIHLDYFLQLPELQQQTAGSSNPIKGNLADHASVLFEEIETLWETAGENKVQFKRELKSKGASWFQQLFPIEIQEMLYNNSARIKSLQIMSEEPHIPWELLVIRDPRKQKGVKPSDKFLGELGVVRWRKETYPPVLLKARENKVRFVIPDYVNEDDKLPAAAIEKAYLVRELKAKEVNADPLKVEQLFNRAGSFDLLHFSCHGMADSKKAAYSMLQLMDRRVNGKYVPSYFTQTTVEQSPMISNKNVSPIIALNSCQTGRAGIGITNHAGFVEAFLKIGAGAFVGSLWSIEDNNAATFIIDFYKCLLRGKTLTEATIEARNAAKSSTDATWISYVVYGHPFAILENK